MNRQTLIRVARALILLAVIALPATVRADPATACYKACFNEQYPAQCGGVPPEEQQFCGLSVVEACRCNCYPPEYCP